MDHILDLEKQKSDLNYIFENIRNSNTILFLGAGASVGEKRYLSNEIIEFYENKIGKNLKEKNISKWLDILSADDNFDRRDFDNFVAELLNKLTLNKGHEILARLPWREIITTNFDLLVEKAFEKVEGSHEQNYTLKPIRNKRDLNYKESNTEVKYIKLNGCLYDKSLYPLAFSSDDFSKLSSFYKLVINELKGVSSDISFLSVGYSFSDEFGKQLLEKFDSYNYRGKRWLFNVDPFPNEDSFAYYRKNKICIVKCSFEEFFILYDEWDREHTESLIKKRGLKINDSRGYYISAPPRLLLNLEGIIRQIDSSVRENPIKEEEFYKGEEPTYTLISKGADVIKSKYLNEFQITIQKNLKVDSTFLPIFFITGDFGIGKSTFALRLLYEFNRNLDFDIVSYEIIDFNRLKIENLLDLIKLSKAEYFVFYCDEIEIESHFKALIELQRKLSIEQIQNCKVFFVAPIRENILEKFKLDKKFNNVIELKLTGKLEEEEISDLLDKLKNANLVSFRDAKEKKLLISKIKSEYDSDSFISLMSSVTSGTHEKDIINCYNQLSKDAQTAFLYTALIHRFKLYMPAAWLKQNILMDWDEFTSKIIQAEGKGILIQVQKVTHGTQPDLFFKTKHPIIAERLVEKFIPNKNKRFSFFEQMLGKIEPGMTSSYLVNDLLKALDKSEEFNTIQMNSLYDKAYTKLSDDPYFLLNYSINLQYRNTEKSIKRAIEYLIYAESFFEHQNHRFIHRRATLNFELAKLYFTEKDLSNVRYYLSEARQLFKVKLKLDPFSSFSFVGYIELIIWEIKNMNLDNEDNLLHQIKLEELFDLAFKTIQEDIERIYSLHSKYVSQIRMSSDKVAYKQHLDELYTLNRFRPYALILLYNFYSEQNDSVTCNQYLQELEHFQYNKEVVKFLFKIYGRTLYNANIRVKFFTLSRENRNYENENPLRFYYFHFVAETYNNNFYEGRTYLNNITNKYYNLNPDFKLDWKDSDGNVVIFEAKITKKTGENFKRVLVLKSQQTVRLIRGNYDNYPIGKEVNVKLHFYLYGLFAEIVV